MLDSKKRKRGKGEYRERKQQQREAKQNKNAARQLHTSANVNLSLPPKYGPEAPDPTTNKGSTSLSTTATSSSPFLSLSSLLASLKIPAHIGCTLATYVSAKKLMRARDSGAVAESLLAGKRWEGCASARNCALMADSLIISSLRVPLLLV